MRNCRIATRGGVLRRRLCGHPYWEKNSLSIPPTSYRVLTSVDLDSSHVVEMIKNGEYQCSGEITCKREKFYH
jgi:hypothetical protein